MTELELQELTDKVIAKLKNESLSIDELLQTNALAGTDFLELNKGRKVSLDDLRKFIKGFGIYLEIIAKGDNETLPTDNNVFSSLRVLFEISKALEELKKIFLRKDQPDFTNFPVRLLGGAEVGESVDSMFAGKGTILTKDGRIQTDRLEVRGYLKVMELLFNRVLAQEADFTFSESGTIEKVEPQADGTYNLTMRKRHDTDFTAFAEQDVAYGAVNTLVTAGEYYTSWFRVLSVNTVANTVNAVLYPDGEVPGGQNFPPSVGMVITRRGNAVNEERQSYWYLSGYEHCICMLDGVTKPVLEENNYSVIIGKLKNLSLFDNLPINYRHSYIYCRGIAIQDLLRVDYQGNPIVQLNDRGAWSAEVAASDQPYTIGREYADTVWHYGCRWKCLMSGTLSEPNYASAGWAMIEGNPEFTIDIDSSNGFEFDYDDFATVLTLTGKIYNRDITSFLLDTDIAWTRDTGNVSEDNAWAVKRSGAGKTLPLTLDDLGPDHTTLGKCFFKATALLRDGEVTNEAEAVINF